MSAVGIREPDQVKLVIWDLDCTVWDGILSEIGDPQLYPGISDIMRELDQRGILQSIASRNDFEDGMEHLTRMGIQDYFLFPQISWGVKSLAIETIVKKINIGMDAVLFIDDQDFELAEARHAHPELRVLHASETAGLLGQPFMKSEKLSTLGPRRRLMYLEDEARSLNESEFEGTSEQFLETLGLRMEISRAGEMDLDRAHELITRTNQLNSTGEIYTTEEIEELMSSPAHGVYIVSLSDKFGDYGKIGLVIIEFTQPVWTLRLILVSCRVLSRGVGPNLLTIFAALARRRETDLCVAFKDTGKNRPMKIALMMAGFSEREERGGVAYLRRPPGSLPSFPKYLEISFDF